MRVHAPQESLSWNYECVSSDVWEGELLLLYFGEWEEVRVTCMTD